MTPILAQVGFLAFYILLMVVARAAARESLRRREADEYERREALKREWRVGIPYDPEPKPKRHERRTPRT